MLSWTKFNLQTLRDIFESGLLWGKKYPPNIPSRKAKSWSPLYGATQWAGEEDCKEQQVFQQRLWHVTFTFLFLRLIRSSRYCNIGFESKPLTFLLLYLISSSRYCNKGFDMSLSLFSFCIWLGAAGIATKALTLLLLSLDICVLMFCIWGFLTSF